MKLYLYGCNWVVVISWIKIIVIFFRSQQNILHHRHQFPNSYVQNTSDKENLVSVPTGASWVYVYVFSRCLAPDSSMRARGTAYRPAAVIKKSTPLVSVITWLRVRAPHLLSVSLVPKPHMMALASYQYVPGPFSSPQRRGYQVPGKPAGL